MSLFCEYFNNMQQSKNDSKSCQPINVNLYEVLNLADYSNNQEQPSNLQLSLQRLQHPQPHHEEGHEQEIGEQERQPANFFSEDNRHIYEPNLSPLPLSSQGFGPSHSQDSEEMIDIQPSNQKDRQINQTKHIEQKSTSNAQKLKVIAYYVKLLITYNINLTNKDLTFIISEIIDQTQFGLEIEKSDFPHISEQQLQTLKKKYAKIQGDSVAKIKNIRRRIYDALKALLGARIIQKYKHSFRIPRKTKNLKAEQDKMQIKQQQKVSQEIQDLQQKMVEVGKKLKQKNKLLELKRKQLLMVSWLLEKNRRESHLDNQYLMFPMLVIPQGDNKIEVKFAETHNEIEIKSEKEIKILADKQLMEKLHKIENESQELG